MASIFTVQSRIRSGFSDDGNESATVATVMVSWDVERLRYMSRRFRVSLAGH